MNQKTEYIWTCKIGGPAVQFQSGADAPMRQAVQAAFKQITGNDEAFCFSGWGGELTEGQRAVVENRLPRTPSSTATEPDDRGEHEAFEAWMRSIGKTDRDLQCDGWNNTGEYSWITERSMWQAWQARALAAPTAPAPTEPVAWGIIARNTGRMCQVTLDKSEIEDHNPAHIVPLVRAAPPSAAAQPEVVGLTDNDLERIFEDAGGKWNGDMWTIEDADFHPAMRSLLASAPTPEPMSAPTAEPVAWNDTQQASLNDWFLSLPEGRQKVLADDKWMLAGAAFLAGQQVATPPIAATPEPSDAKPSFREPTWKDEPPDWCSPKEEEIWQAGYDSAMASVRSMNRSTQSGPVMHAPSGFTFDTVLAAANPEDLVSLTPPEPSDAERCPYCDDTGDVHDQTGEWRGTCKCPAGKVEACDIEAAAKVIAERMDYPWEHMYEKGRNNMRDIAREAIRAAIRATKGGKL